jgi:hypothetical protein
MLEGFGRFVANVAVAVVEHGPEALETMALVRVQGEYYELLEAEWANHPLLDFMRWQTPEVGQTMALTLPQGYLAGHAALADLLGAVFARTEIVDQLESVVDETGFSGWAVDEFRHGLAHFRCGELDRALAPLTLGLEGLIRDAGAKCSIVTDEEIVELRSGSRLVKRLWGVDDAYRPYMEKWVFGLANVYRHGGDRGGSEAQALHALCGAAIWADHLLGRQRALAAIRARLSVEVTSQYAQGRLQIQPDAVARLHRAAERANASESVKQLLAMRQQLLDVRDQQRRQGVRRSVISPQQPG